MFTQFKAAVLRKVAATDVGDENGQGLVEYSLILVFVAVVAIAALTFLGTDISSALSSIGLAL